MLAGTTCAHSSGCRESACGPPALWLGAPLQAAAGRATEVKLQTEVRDAWKAHASDAAAAFTIGWIKDKLPLLPLGKKLGLLFFNPMHSKQMAELVKMSKTVSITDIFITYRKKLTYHITDNFIYLSVNYDSLHEDLLTP